jgi:hypothetical protein
MYKRGNDNDGGARFLVYRDGVPVVTAADGYKSYNAQIKDLDEIVRLANIGLQYDVKK